MLNKKQNFVAFRRRKLQIHKILPKYIFDNQKVAKESAIFQVVVRLSEHTILDILRKRFPESVRMVLEPADLGGACVPFSLETQPRVCRQRAGYPLAQKTLVQTLWEFGRENESIEPMKRLVTREIGVVIVSN